MSKLKRIVRSPWTGGAAAIVSAGIAALSWAGLPFLADPAQRFVWLSTWFGMFVLFTTWAFIAQQIQIRELKSRFDSAAALVFNPVEEKHVQRGKVMREAVGGAQLCDEYRYAIGVVNLSAQPVPGCRLILEDSKPHDTSAQRLETALRVRSDPSMESTGVFTLNPGDGQRPTAYIEALQELVPFTLLHEPAVIRLIYANSAGGQANWFSDRRDHTLTFRLEGQMAESVSFKLLVRYDADARRYSIQCP
jgi:hypothetical protein